METKIIAVRLLAIVLLALAPATLSAQSATGTIRGTVADPDGAPLANVTITVVNTATGVQQERTTDALGRFIAPALPAGPYELSASLPDFALRRQEDITLGQSETVTLRLELEKSRAPDTITVGTTPRVVDAARTYAGGAISGSELLMLPSIDRSALGLARLIPGPGVFPAVIDGTEADDQAISLEAVADLRVLNAAPPSEYAGPLTALVSRSGSRRFSGSAFDFMRDGRSQFGGTLGGPLAERHFFFGSYDGIHTDLPAGDSLRHALLVRSDHLLTADHRLTLRFDDDVRSRMMASAGSTMGRAMNEVRLMATADSRQLADTLTVVAGGHTLRTGFDVGDIALSGDGVDRYGVFVEDQVWMGPITVEGGVRYGRDRLPLLGLIDTEANWQPRVGAAWSGVDGRLAVRGAYRGMGAGVHHTAAGAEWEWMPRTSISAGYLEYRHGTGHKRGFTAELYRRFSQGTHFRAAYTRGVGEPVDPLLAALLPRNRLNASLIYTTNVLASRYDGFLETLLEDWLASGVVTYQTAIGTSISPRIARNIPVNGTVRVTLLWEAFNLLNNEDLLTPRRHQVAARLSF